MHIEIVTLTDHISVTKTLVLYVVLVFLRFGRGRICRACQYQLWETSGWQL